MNRLSPRPRLGIIGISGYGRVHLQLARECLERGDVEIVAATVINPDDEKDALAKLLAGGTKIFSDYREMLREFSGKLDLCLIPTGIHWHARMTIAALESGANVLVEKPLAGSVAEVQAIRAAEQRTGRFVAVGFQDFYEPGTTWLRDALRNGAIGKIESVRFLGLWPRNRDYFTRNNWAGRLEVSGVPVLDSPVNNAFAHFVMLGLVFTGADRRGSDVAIDSVELYRAHAIESFDTCVLTGRTPSGVRLWFGVSHACRDTVEPEIAITGTEGEACWRYEAVAWWRRRDGAGERRELQDAYGARRAMLTASLQHLWNSAVPICTTEMAGQHTALVEAIHRTGRIVVPSADLITWAPMQEKAAPVPDVTGLGEAMRRAFAQESTLATAGFTAPAGSIANVK